MDWPEIMKYQKMIYKISIKYSGNRDLADDVSQEVMLKLYEDKNLDTSKFDPKKKDAAIRNTIRNKALKVLTSKKIGRFPHLSLDGLSKAGFQFDIDKKMIAPKILDKSHPGDLDYYDSIHREARARPTGYQQYTEQG